MKRLAFLEDDHVELYHLAEDLGEQTDLAPSRPEISARLKRQLHDWRKAVNAAMPVPNPGFKAS